MDGRSAGTVALGVLGWGVSYALFFRYLAGGGTVSGGWVAAFTANDWATGLLLDLVAVSAMVVFLTVRDRARLGATWVAAILGSLALSASMALMLYLLASWRTATPSA